MIHFDFRELCEKPFAVRCPTEEEAETLFEFLLNETDVRWCTNDLPKCTNYASYQEGTHYYFGSTSYGLTYGNGGWAADHGVYILSVAEFLEMCCETPAENDIPDFDDIL